MSGSDLQQEHLQYANSEKQRGIVQGLLDGKSWRTIQAETGVGAGTISRAVKSVKTAAALKGFAPANDLTHPVPEPFYLKGYSQYYDKEGKPGGKWLKTATDVSVLAEQLREYVEWLVQDAAGRATPVPAPAVTDSDLLTNYMIGDPHFGMYAWAPEADDDFDLDIAEQHTLTGIADLMARTPRSGECRIIELGDLLHTDTQDNRTRRSGNPLDVDSRWLRVVKVARRAMTRIVEMALAHHETVHVKIVMGNHDDHSAVLMAEILEAFFRNEPRVIVDTSPNPYYYFTFGQNLFGVHHGNEIKPTDLPGIMAVDQAANWQADQHRYFLLGDKHHVEGKNEKGGVNWEIFPTIIPRDAWHHRKGYRSTRRMSAITYHRNFGEWERTVCPIDRIKYEINQRNKS